MHLERLDFECLGAVFSIVIFFLIEKKNVAIACDTLNPMSKLILCCSQVRERQLHICCLLSLFFITPELSPKDWLTFNDLYCFGTSSLIDTTNLDSIFVVLKFTIYNCDKIITAHRNLIEGPNYAFGMFQHR